MFDVSLFVVMDTGETVCKDDFCDETRDGARFIMMTNDVRFIMMTNDMLCPDYGRDDTLFVSADCVRQVRKISNENCEGVKWYSFQDDFPDFGNACGDGVTGENIFYVDLDGYANTHDIMSVYPEIINRRTSETVDPHGQSVSIPGYMPKEYVIPAVMCAFNTCVGFRRKSYHGYLPGISELLIFGMNVAGVNDILRLCGKDTFDIRTRNFRDGSSVDCIWNVFWSSTTRQRREAFIYNQGEAGGVRMYRNREPRNGHGVTVLPFFKIDL